MVGTGQWAKYWILIKWWEPLEIACKINTIVFDKTWTLTKWKPEVTNIISLNNDEILLINIAQSLETHSEHPLAEAILQYRSESKLLEVENFLAIPGKWVQWNIVWTKYLLGTRDLMKENNIQITNEEKIQELENQGKTVMLLSDWKNLLWMIAVADQLKDDAEKIVQKLINKWFEIYMITWDNTRTAQAIANQLWIKNILAQVLPQEKSEKIKELQSQWKVVAMVWDGINDAPALIQANLWIAMWNWTDVALESWWIILMSNNLEDVINSISLSKETVNKIKQNMIFAFLYNILGIPLAAGVFIKFGMMLKPEFAGLAMAMSSVSVVTNSLLLKFFRPWKSNIISKFAPIIMTIIFLFAFREFGQISVWWFGDNTIISSNIDIQTKKEISNFLSNKQNKIWFTPTGIPKIFIESDQSLSWIIIVKWVWIINKDMPQLVLWYKEALMMKREKLFKNIWDNLKDFFGIDSIQIAWILAPTDTFLDEVHIINTKWFEKLSINQDLWMTQSNSWILKIFYMYDKTNIPLKWKKTIKGNDNIKQIDWKDYISLYIGYDEALMMKKEKLFTNIGDKIDNLFWKNIYIAWILKKTYTTLDMIHFIPKDSNK
jgi:magnesium-transporting ATPase (P-type)